MKPEGNTVSIESSKNRYKAHQIILNDVLKACVGRTDLRIWKQTTGATQNSEGRYISFGKKGSADLSGILLDGTRLEVEIKSGKATQSKEQINFQTMIERYKGLYILCFSKDDFLTQLENYISNQKQCQCFSQKKQM